MLLINIPIVFTGNQGVIIITLCMLSFYIILKHAVLLRAHSSLCTQIIADAPLEIFIDVISNGNSKAGSNMLAGFISAGFISHPQYPRFCIMFKKHLISEYHIFQITN